MSDQEFIFAPPTVKVDFDIPVVETIQNSMYLLFQAEDLSGLGEWVGQTAAALSAERMQKHRLVFQVLLMGAEYEKTPASYPEYIDRVAMDKPEAIQARFVARFMEKAQHYGVTSGVTLDADDFLSDVDTFVNTVEAIYTPLYETKGKPLDLDLYREAYPLVQNPEQYKAYVLEHLRYMWDNHMRDEWYRVLPTLQECVVAFKQLDFSAMSAPEAIRKVTRRDLSQYFPEIEQAESVVFVPSAHIGPYNIYYKRDDVFYLIFGARTPEGVQSKSPALDRSELLVHLNALADDTRLKILELLTWHEELCAQDIITTLDLSQSSASRHLRQLTATGYLVERRRDVAKCYTLSDKRIDETMNALKHFLRNRSYT